MLTELQYRILRKIAPRGKRLVSMSAGLPQNKLEVMLGKAAIEQFKGKTIIDFGCGFGDEVIHMAQLGAKRVYGIDNRPEILEIGREKAQKTGLESRCIFDTKPPEKADIIVSIDAFEHFEKPAEILEVMHSLLKPDGFLVAAFGPTWYHPLGGHLFSIFPWGHLLFSEKALIKWRRDFRDDGATKFSEVSGGLNRMTIRRFEKLVDKSSFALDYLKAVPIKKLKFFHNRLTREFTTSIVRCKLVK